MSIRYQTKVRPVAVYTMGTNLQPNVPTKVDIGQLIPPMVDVGYKSVLVKLVAKITATITTNGSSPAVAHRNFRYLFDKELIGPAGFKISADRRGWHDSHWGYLQRGFIDEVRGNDIPANTASATRTWTQSIDFEEPNSQFPLARCYAVEAFKASGAGLWITLRNAATIKGTACTVSAATVTLTAYVLDVPAREVPIPVAVAQFALQSDAGAISPSPGPGKFLRVLMANSPVPADNLDGTATDDLAAYTQIDSFGYTSRFSVYQESVERLLDRVMRTLSVEKPSPLASQAANSSMYRIYDPNYNFDGLTPGIPLVVPSKGTDFMASAPTFEDFPRLNANGGSRAGLPGGFFFLCERIEPRTTQMLNAYVGALTDVNGKTILGRAAKPAGTGDPSRTPLLISCA